MDLGKKKNKTVNKGKCEDMSHVKTMALFLQIHVCDIMIMIDDMLVFEMHHLLTNYFSLIR